MFVDRGPRFNADKFWFCQLPNASYSRISKALLILSARFSDDNEVICDSILPWSTAVVIYHGFNLSEGMGLGPYLQSGQIQGRQQLTSPTLAEPRHFFGKSETYGQKGAGVGHRVAQLR